MAGKISEYTVSLVVFGNDDLMDVSKKISSAPDVWETEKVSFSTLKSAVRDNIYSDDGSLSADRVLTMNDKTLTFERASTPGYTNTTAFQFSYLNGGKFAIGGPVQATEKFTFYQIADDTQTDQHFAWRRESGTLKFSMGLNNEDQFSSTSDSGDFCFNTFAGSLCFNLDGTEAARLETGTGNFAIGINTGIAARVHAKGTASIDPARVDTSALNYAFHVDKDGYVGVGVQANASHKVLIQNDTNKQFSQAAITIFGSSASHSGIQMSRNFDGTFVYKMAGMTHAGNEKIGFDSRSGYRYVVNNIFVAFDITERTANTEANFAFNTASDPDVMMKVTCAASNVTWGLRMLHTTAQSLTGYAAGFEKTGVNSANNIAVYGRAENGAENYFLWGQAGSMFVPNTTPITTNPTGGIIMYSESGVGKYRDPSGNVITI